MSANPEEMTTPTSRSIGIADRSAIIQDRARAFYELAKPNLSGLVVVTAAFGFYLASSTVPHTSWTTFIYLVLGTALTAAGACAINMVLEVEHDSLMRRTRGRPLPSGRLTRAEATLFALVLFAWGFGQLLLFCGPWPAFLSLASALIYATLYTPMKRKGPAAVWVGAVVGALPPVMGWTAVTGGIGAGGVVLFAILFAWQFPHFLSLGFMYREDYQRAGYRFVSQSPDEVGRQVWIGTVLLLIVSVMPVGAKLCGVVYLAGALAAGGLFVWMAIRFGRNPTRDRARAVFFASITYLPMLFALMVLDRLLG